MSQTTVQGHNGVVSITDQNATVVNIGIAGANTGGNVAVGNGSVNNANANQNATTTGGAGDAVATNDATVRNDSGGDARIQTGDATATGSTSNNVVNQSSSIDCPNCLGVVALGDQNATIVNVGIAGANTGGNAAVGNASINNAAALQNSAATSTGNGDTVAANTGTASTNSGGSAGIITGDATAVGNVATNSVTQIRNINAPGAMGVIVLGDQNATTVNAGAAAANTGLNVAVGNGAVSTSNAVQGAVSGAGPPADDAVASNDGTASTNSNGSANIATGNATAAGNRSTTNLTQALNVNTTGHVLVLADQNANAINIGFALANTGGNIGVGNASVVNVAAVAQNAAANNAGANNGDTVAANFGTADTNSNGSAAISTGNAAAAGNESTTNVSQAINVNSSGGLVLPDQNVLVVNAGIGIANSGLNAAVGNASVNVAAAAQAAAATNNGDDVVASNFGDASTTSNGSASIATGNADSIGNASGASTNISQSVNTNGADMVLTDQNANVVNFGAAVSNTGLNAAVGNASVNVAATVQNAVVNPASADAVASNFGDASTDSDGSASITTGNANAVGSEAHTNIAQSVNANGANGFLLSDQTATDVNIGVAAANTGLNLAIGSVAVSVVAVAQLATVLNGGTDDVVAANFGTSKTKSNGSASIHSGNAAAVGTRSTTNIAQAANIDGAGFSLPDQTATAVSVGFAVANTGGNIALGNASVNVAALGQDAVLPNNNFPNADDLVASNDGTVSTESNGNAEIWTGSANAIGNDSASTTNISQAANSNNGAFLLADQNATVVNVGVAAANSGLNLAVGNASVNVAAGAQSARIREQGAGSINADDVVVSNDSTVSTNSNGSAKIVTGPSSATGNASTTNVSQAANHNGTGFTLADQNATVVNVGLAGANSGLNAAVGNASVNVAATQQAARIRETDAGSIRADDLVASNNATTSTNSNGSATVITGASTAVGSASTTTVNQASNTNVLGNGFALNDQNAVVVNIGAGVANSGLNAAVGNGSINVAAANQIARVREAGPGSLRADDVAVVNNATNTTNSNGSASVETGWTNATGNKSTTTVNQAANTNISGNGFTLNDQNATVVNAGFGLANSGINLAVGNGSVNASASAQRAVIRENGPGSLRVDDAVASNSSQGGNTSDGTASILTGSATAIGNDAGATTIVNQASNTNIAGSGFALGDQNAVVVNVGIGVANSGINLAAGNVSQNTVLNTQAARIRESGVGGLNIAGDAVVANDATQWNQSNGSASVKTGDAIGSGNKSTTVVNQTANNNIDGNGFDLTDNTVVVANVGVGVGNSGINAAIGNASQNINIGPQFAEIRETGAGSLNVGGDAVASNTASLSNNSDGHASITTGVACGFGNNSSTEVNANGDGAVLVLNIGIGVGNSGINAAVGNGSINTVTDTQRARFFEADAGSLNIADDAVAANEVTSTNQSNGTADIHTGGATGFGNTSTTMTNGDSIVVNFGLGIANTGINVGVGNASVNTITSNTVAGFVEAGPGGLNLGDDGVASNVITESNNSNGTVNLTTGDAYALGNRSATGTVNAQDDDDATALTLNVGFAFANSGLNVGAGNTSVNNTTHFATATAPGTVASNVATLSNTSDGTATIHTGNANAFGNIASNATCQGLGFGVLCPQPVLPPLPLPCPCPKPGTNVPPVTPPPTGQPPVNNPPVNHPSVSLPNTGGSVEGLALLGLLLLAIGVFLRRKARTA